MSLDNLKKINQVNADKNLSLQHHHQLLDSSTMVANTVLSATTSLIKRFWSKVNKTDDCWLWIGCKNKAGYGVIMTGSLKNDTRKTRLTHVLSYELNFGNIPQGLELDHLCRIRHCVNPFHLETVTHKENVSRGEAGKITGRINSNKTHCPKGHEYSNENTRVYRNKRNCLTCYPAKRGLYGLVTA